METVSVSAETNYEHCHQLPWLWQSCNFHYSIVNAYLMHSFYLRYARQYSSSYCTTLPIIASRMYDCSDLLSHQTSQKDTAHLRYVSIAASPKYWWNSQPSCKDSEMIFLLAVIDKIFSACCVLVCIATRSYFSTYWFLTFFMW